MGDHPLGRIKRFDERSRAFPIAAVPDAELALRGYTWRPGLQLDQIGSSCVAWTVWAEFLARPAPGSPGRFTEADALAWYHAMQHDDPWAGCHLGRRCPIAPSAEAYGGTSMLAGFTYAVKTLKIARGYRWAFSTATALYGLGRTGPAMTGTNWYSEMMEPDADGRIRPVGAIEGGHATLWYRFVPAWVDVSGPRTIANLDLDTARVFKRGSWGDWGPLHGDAWMTVRDFARLQYEDGEVAFLTGRRTRV